MQSTARQRSGDFRLESDVKPLAHLDGRISIDLVEQLATWRMPLALKLLATLAANGDQADAEPELADVSACPVDVRCGLFSGSAGRRPIPASTRWTISKSGRFHGPFRVHGWFVYHLRDQQAGRHLPAGPTSYGMDDEILHL